MRNQSPFLFNGLSAMVIAIAVAVGFCIVHDESRSSIEQWVLFSVSLPLLVFLLLIPACWFANKIVQSLLGRLPSDGLDDAEPIRFDESRADDG